MYMAVFFMLVGCCSSVAVMLCCGAPGSVPGVFGALCGVTWVLGVVRIEITMALC